MNRRTWSFLIAMLLVAAACTTWAQEKGTNPGVKPLYYLDINKVSKETVNTIHDELLAIQYYDSYGQEKEIPLKIYNWKREQVATYSLSKEFGLNNFSINLGVAYDSWKEGEMYTCEMADESGHRYELILRKQTLKNEPPKVNLLVNPVHLQCKELTGNLVEFYGEISGGKTPYQVSWYVLNNDRTDFLYQPREEVVTVPGNTLVIRVDKNPDYYVMLHVRDACGNEQKQIVHLVCQGKKKKINTLFVEPLKELPNRTKT